jgi:cystathionine beta-lyase
MTERLPTELIHHPYRPPSGFESVQPAVHKASTVMFANVAALRARDWRSKAGYTYGLHGTPTTFTLEERLASLEGAAHVTLAPSGLAAIALTNMALLQSGDEVLIPHNVYDPNRVLLRDELTRWGVRVGTYDAQQPQTLATAISQATRLVWCEAAGSISMEFPDVPALVQVVQQANAGRSRRVLTALDHTWGAGVAYRPFDWHVDVAVHALTKYPSGGADVLMGSVAVQAPELHELVLQTHKRLGMGVGANDAEAVLRGLPSMVLRYQAQDQSTRALAQWLAEQPAVAQVLHPALPGSPGHEAWARLCQGAACLFSAVFAPQVTQAQIDAFCDRLRRFRLGYSWAGPVSLCAPYNMGAIRPEGWAHAGGLVRFSVGLEDTADLQADLAQALAAL